MVNFAYIGGGATATTLLWQHVRRLEREIEARWLDPARAPIEITVFDRSGVFGCGLPYGAGNLDCHLVNMQSSTLSIDPERGDDFVDWMAANSEPLRTRYPGIELSADSYPPRTAFGQYLMARFGEAEAIAARHGVRVHRIAQEVVGIAPRSAGMDVRCASGDEFHADHVVLATGHWPSSRTRHCEAIGARLAADRAGGHFFPWPAQELRARIPPGARVAVLGTSLTALDAALTLLEDGGHYATGSGPHDLVFHPGETCRWVVMHSRTGLLPRVRSTRPPIPYPNPHLTKESIPALVRDGVIEYDEVMALFHQRIEFAHDFIATGEPVGDRAAFDWQRLFDPLAGARDVNQRCLEVLEADLRDALTGSPQWHRVHHTIRDTYGTFAQIYRRLTAADRRRLDREFFRAFNAHAGAMPVDNAVRLRALLRSGRLRVLGGVVEVCADDPARHFAIRCVLPDGSCQTSASSYLVDASGQDRRVELARSRLLSSALKQGLLSLHDAGGIRVDYDHSHVIGRDGVRSDRLSAIGAMALGERIGASAIVASAKAARLLVDRWMTALISARPGAE